MVTFVDDDTVVDDTASAWQEGWDAAVHFLAVEKREAMARLIDPSAFESDASDPRSETERGYARASAYRAADRIVNGLLSPMLD